MSVKNDECSNECKSRRESECKSESEIERERECAVTVSERVWCAVANMARYSE